jgi:phosphate-selective porin OprO/OprP
VCLLLSLALTTSAGAESDDDWKIKWDNGFKVESADKQFKLKFGGRLQADWTFVDPDEGIEAEVGEFDDGNEFRRARLFVSGLIYEKVEFKVQYDFGGGDADFKDVYAGFKDTPIGNLRFGHFKEPFSLEELTSSKYITFLERSLPNVFSPGRNTGFMIHDKVGKRFTWAAGAFRESNDFAEAEETDGKLNVTGRVTGLPIYQDDGRQLIHVGLSATNKNFKDDPFRIRQRPEAHQTERFVDTGQFQADGLTTYTFEVAGVFGRFWFAAEHTMAEADTATAVFEDVTVVDSSDPNNLVFSIVPKMRTACADPNCMDGDDLGDPSFSGTYVQAGFFLTDDHRRYKTSAGSFDRMKPSRNYGDGGGAVELAVRYSTLDLTDEGIAGGELNNMSFAVNWYLNPATRLMFNYVNADRDDIEDGTATFYLVRFQVDF